ncbi:MAG: isoprenyl transferase [Armatimonadetes bacterium]|nr:isoprenyl transferase [Armatimonadota bacterium]MDW8122045.1 isoprenyl transferase [Armatimonadota bacterium]
MRQSQTKAEPDIDDLIQRLDRSRLPRHIAVIMDGNRRWALQRGLPVLEGHRAGAEATRRVVEICGDIGVPILTLYAFSTENWKRPKPEVDGLVALIEETLRQERAELHANGVRVRHIGSRHGLPQSLMAEMEETETLTQNNTRLLLNVAINYGGRDELIRAVRSLAKKVADGTIQPEEITEAMLASHLDTAGIADPDLLIRTGNEYRISNFLLWQIAYAEIHISPVLWPDFTKRDFLLAVLDYQRRERRFGGRVDESS